MEWLGRLRPINEASTARSYEHRIEVLTTIHKKCLANLNWREIAQQPAPAEPLRDTSRSDAAQAELWAYRPSVYEKWSGIGARRRQALLLTAQEAIDEEDRAYAAAKEKHQQELAHWREMQAFAAGILSGDAGTVVRLVERFNPLSGIEGLGVDLTITTDGRRYVEAILDVNDEDTVPNFELHELSYGQTFTREMPAGRYWQLYQDYICGCVLRLGRELLGLVPIDLVIVHAARKVLDTSTGHHSHRAILSVAMPRATMARLNFAALDCSDALRNFTHIMTFSETEGFLPVPMLHADHVQITSG